MHDQTLFSDREQVDGISFETFSSDDDIKEIVSFNVLQIGELAKNLSPELLERYPDMPWKSIKGTRDRVAYGYGTLDLKEVWNTANDDIKPLREYCERIIGENN